ncbi:high affinity immunoglobulin epsilon receptor subunit gamma [Tympanuchus pallidicinctus]|uniref:high affinity immunoglobulin epsilon receptor subunit gamma n=1 Tax=Tympanuchus pallidicinctus TaxID=109042 RepID=UPI0022872411|nr:high affinity immunoglobulin epsilon receptor subunit gamma [Tympanuchus pallidicinctus]
MRAWLPLAAALLLQVPAAEALAEPELCYVLDGILFLYGIVLTILYCHLKIVTRRAVQEAPKKPDEGIYTGLSSEHQETYEMLQHKP